MKRRKAIGGGGAGHPASLANLKRGGQAASRGNQRAKTHGGYAKIARGRLETKVMHVFDALAADAPLRAADGSLPAQDGAIVRLLAEVLCRLDDVAANVRDYGLIDERTGDPRAAVDLERRLRHEASEYLDAIGMTPRSRTRLGLDSAAARGLDRQVVTTVAPADERARRKILRTLVGRWCSRERPLRPGRRTSP